MVKIADSQLWHKNFGHLIFTDVKNTIPGTLYCAEDFCEISALCEFTKVPVPKETEVKSMKSPNRVFFDMKRPLNLRSVHGFRYVPMIVDEDSKFKVVKCFRARREALEWFQDFIA